MLLASASTSTSKVSPFSGRQEIWRVETTDWQAQGVPQKVVKILKQALTKTHSELRHSTNWVWSLSMPSSGGFWRKNSAHKRQRSTKGCPPSEPSQEKYDLRWMRAVSTWQVAPSICKIQTWAKTANPKFKFQIRNPQSKIQTPNNPNLKSKIQIRNAQCWYRSHFPALRQSQKQKQLCNKIATRV